MNLSKTGLLARLYDYTYGKSLPNDLCSFFWKTLIALIVFPVTSLTFWIEDIRGFVERVMIGSLCWLGILVVAGVIFTVYAEPAMGLVYLVIGLGIGLVIFLAGRKPNKRLADNEVVKVVRERFNGFKEGYCPRINWE